MVNNTDRHQRVATSSQWPISIDMNLAKAPSALQANTSQMPFKSTIKVFEQFFKFHKFFPFLIQLNYESI